MLECVRADSSDAFLCLLPLQHVFASVVSFLLPLYLGATVVFADTLKRSEILEALEEAGISILATVPQFFYLFHDRIEEELRKKPAVVRRLFRALLRANRVAQRFGVNLGKTLFGKIHRNFGSRLRLFVSGGSHAGQYLRIKPVDTATPLDNNLATTLYPQPAWPAGSSFAFGVLDSLDATADTVACGGVDAASAMGDEIQNPRKTMPWAILVGGTVVTLGYIGGTMALLVALAPRVGALS